MLIIGLTGGIATGKSTVAQMIRDLGFPVICADELARGALDKGTNEYKRVVETFGQSILTPKKDIDRQKLAQVVFNDEKKRQLLNNIVHPAVLKGIEKEMTKNAEKSGELIVLDIPLLFEENLDDRCNEIIVVYAPESLMRERMADRNEWSEEEMSNRLASQMPIEQKKEKADYVIDNSGSLEETKKQVEELFQKLGP